MGAWDGTEHNFASSFSGKMSLGHCKQRGRTGALLDLRYLFHVLSETCDPGDHLASAYLSQPFPKMGPKSRMAVVSVSFLVLMSLRGAD